MLISLVSMDFQFSVRTFKINLNFKKNVSVLLKLPLILVVTGRGFCGFVWMKLDENFIVCP